MNDELIKLMKQNKTVILTKGNLFLHYSVVLILLIAPVLSLWSLFEFHILNNYDSVRTPMFETFDFVCLGLAILAFIYQFRRLRFDTIKMASNKDQFIEAVNDTAKELDWVIDYYDDDFVRAHRDWNWSPSWGEMITIIRDEDQVLINSICDPNAFHVSITSWGWNTKHIQTFKSKLKKAST